VFIWPSQKRRAWSNCHAGAEGGGKRGDSGTKKEKGGGGKKKKGESQRVGRQGLWDQEDMCGSYHIATRAFKAKGTSGFMNHLVMGKGGGKERKTRGEEKKKRGKKRRKCVRIIASSSSPFSILLRTMRRKNAGGFYEPVNTGWIGLLSPRVAKGCPVERKRRRDLMEGGEKKKEANNGGEVSISMF